MASSKTRGTGSVPMSLMAPAALIGSLALSLLAVIVPPWPDAQAQGTVTPSCPAGFVFSGGTCVSAAPAPTCPDGFVFANGACVAAPASNGPWFLLVGRALGVTSVTQLGGATVCVQFETPSETALIAFFNQKARVFEPVAIANEKDGVDKYTRGECDVTMVTQKVALQTLNALTPPGDHMLLPELIPGTVQSAPPSSPVATAPTQPEPAPQQPIRRAAPDAQSQPPSQPVRRAAPQRTQPQEPIATALQRELKRIGCLPGKVDGVWGRGSRAALDRFAQQAGLRLGREPSPRALEEARRTEAGYCRPVRTASRPPANTTRRGSADFDIRDGYDLPGNDYRRVGGKVDFNTCLSTCEHDSECFGFTYNTSARACFLKWRGQNWTRFANAVSGVRITGSQANDGFDEERAQQEWEEEQRRIRELEEQEDQDPSWGNTQVTADNYDMCRRNCEEDEAVCGTDQSCAEAYEFCMGGCAIEAGDCFTGSDGVTVCP